MALRVLAISAPQWVAKVSSSKDDLSFNSQTPFSLQNALRDAIDAGMQERSSIWAHSNLADREKREYAVMMLEYWEDEKELFFQRFDSIRPHLLLIGSMSLSFPGAIKIARYAKKRRGEKVCVVLGGKHVSETMFLSRFGGIKHHVGSPLMLMYEKSIPQVFDICVGGDGEKIITRIGEIIGTMVQNKSSFAQFKMYAERLEITESEGDWVLGFIHDNKFDYFQSGDEGSIDYLNLGLSIDQFSLTKGFNIFGTRYTAHAYSDSSRGCAYDCFFCSEKFRVSGDLRLKTTMSVERLLQQFKRLANHPSRSVSIFVEDSIFLSGKPTFIELFVAELNQNQICVPFGIQLTLDTFLLLADSTITGLRQVGLEYIAFGIETISEDVAQSLSKNSNKLMSWAEKITEVVKKCSSFNLKCGMFLIWGLGENQVMRKNQLLQIRSWIDEYHIAIDVGLNIATQHPLQIVDDTSLNIHNYKKHNYIDWGTDQDDPYLPYFTELFGEASVRYAIYPELLPSVEEIIELRTIYLDIKNTSYNLVG